MEPFEQLDGGIDITCYVDDDYARVELYDGHGALVAAGKAKRDPLDKSDRVLAVTLAMGRAFERLGQKQLRKANGLIKHADDMREQRQVQKARPRKPKPTSSYQSHPYTYEVKAVPTATYCIGDVVEHTAVSARGKVIGLKSNNPPTITVEWDLPTGPITLNYEGHDTIALRLRRAKVSV